MDSADAFPFCSTKMNSSGKETAKTSTFIEALHLLMII